MNTAAIVRASLSVFLPSQLRALRLRRSLNQKEFAKIVGMKQSRICLLESPGAAMPNLNTLLRIAASLGIGLKVEFVSLEEMYKWENEFNQDDFDPRETLIRHNENR